jgi:hypothetical protein
MATWEQMEVTHARTKAAWQAFTRLREQTPEEERDEQGWTPELLAAAQRHADLSLKWFELAQEYMNTQLTKHADE